MLMLGTTSLGCHRNRTVGNGTIVQDGDVGRCYVQAGDGTDLDQHATGDKPGRNDSFLTSPDGSNTVQQ